MSFFVIPANACMDAGGRATHGAKAEAGIQGVSQDKEFWIPAFAGMTAVLTPGKYHSVMKKTILGMN